MKIKSNIGNRVNQGKRHSCATPQSHEIKSNVPKTDLAVNLSGFHIGILAEAAIMHGCSIEQALELFLDGVALPNWQGADFPLS
jgi:hypothetical protein